MAWERPEALRATDTGRPIMKIQSTEHHGRYGAVVGILAALLLPVAAGALHACTGRAPAADQPRADTVTPGEEAAMAEDAERAGDGGEVLHGKATVESVDVVRLESYPTQIRVTAQGYLADSCTELGEVRQGAETEEKRLWVEITTVRPADAFCTQVIKPFEKSLHLDVVYGLPTGTYTLDVNGVEVELVLNQEDVDQISPDDGG